MNRKELIAALGITPAQLAEWIRQGLPHDRKGNMFEPQAVRDWLVLNGFAKNASVVSTQAEVARHFHVNPRTVGTWLATGCPGEPGAYDLDQIAAWRETQRGGDPLLAGVVSPALERYRDERAKLARLDRLARERTLIDRAAIHADLNDFCRIVRQGIERLQREYGEGAFAIMREAIEEASANVERKWNDIAEAGGTPVDPQPPQEALT